MIYTVTFNPAVDYVVRMDRLQPGRVNRTREDLIQFGGKGINVSTVLKNLGFDNVALGFVAGFTGEAVDQGLRDLGVRTDFIRLRRGLTRINVKIKAEDETEINARGPLIDAGELEQLFEKLEALRSGDILVLAGSIPSCLSGDVYERILERLEGRGVLAAVDAERDLLCSVLKYRPFLIKPNHLELGAIFGRVLRTDAQILECARAAVDAERDLLCSVLKYRPFLIKPNHLELGAIFGRVLRTDAQILECARTLQERGARNVLVSMAGEGALLLDETGETHRIGVPKGVVKNSVGAGDSMVAGFLAGWLESGDYAWALRMGAAAGSATSFSDGLAEKQQVLELLDTF